MTSFADLTDAEVEAKIVDSQKRAKEALKETRETFTTAEVGAPERRRSAKPTAPRQHPHKPFLFATQRHIYGGFLRQ